MTIDPAPRPTFYQGQYLGPEDLEATVRYGADHAARHALGAHTWGVGTGLAVLASGGAGSVEYWVQPGVAWDGLGRTLLVPAPLKITPDHLRTQPYDPVADGTAGPGQLVSVWLRFREDATTPPARGYDECEEGGFSRWIERVDVIVRNFATELETQQLVDVGGRTVAPREAVGAWYPASPDRPTIEDGSVAFQRFPGAGEVSRWLVPIGVVRWKVAAPGSTGGLGTFVLPQPTDAAATLARRRLVGVVAGSVLGTEGVLRLRPREMDAPTLWTKEPLWLETTTRLDGDLHLFGGPPESERGGVDFLDGLGTTAGRRVRISRHERGAATDLRVQVGPTGGVATRLVVGTEAPGATPADPPVFTDAVVVTSNGRVGVGIPTSASGPTHPLHVTSPLGIRQGSLHLTGAEGWSSLAYNAHHSEDNAKWVAPDPQRASSTIELDDGGGANPRFGVYTAPPTTTPDTIPDWKLGLHLDGVTNHVGLGGPSSAAATVIVRGIGNTTLRLSPSGVGAGPATSFGVSAAGAFVTTGNVDFALRTNSTDRVTVKNDGRVGIGITAPEASLHVSGEPTDVSAENLGAHVAIIENRSVTSGADVLALRVGTVAGDVGENNNFITFFAGADAIGRIEQQTAPNGTKTLRLATGGADFAESMPAMPGERLLPGDVVAVVAGQATQVTGSASWISVVTDRAIVLGNDPSNPTSDDVAITMLGQVPVRVRGAAAPGDLLVPSGDDDGRAIAYAPRELPVERANQVFGEVVNVDPSTPDSVTSIVGGHARSAALIAIVQRLFARSGD